MCDVLVLTAKFGQGHLSVSTAIQNMFKEKKDNLEVICIDPFDYFCDEYDKYQKIYNKLSGKMPKIYEILYKYKEKWPNNLLDAFIYRRHWRKMDEILNLYKPKVVISTFPMCSGLVARVKRYRYLKLPLITVITDVVDSWEWIHEETDCYCVAAPHIKKALKKKGISEDKISVTGIPVRSDFLKNKKIIGKEKWQVLIVASSMQQFKINEQSLRSLEELKHFNFVLVTGKEKKLFDSLKNKRFSNIQVLGYTNKMHNLMLESDFIVTKPGGITIHEAIHCELPLVLTGKAIGQEKINAKFIECEDLGITIQDFNELKTMLFAIEDDLKKYKVWQVNLKKARKWQDQSKIIKKTYSFLTDTLLLKKGMRI